MSVPLPTYKLLLMGDSGTGKSSILLRFTDDKFLPEDAMNATIGVDFKVKFVEMDGQRVKLTIWDTAGQERFRTLTSSYYRGAQGVMLVYDVTNRETFDNLKNIWLKELQVYTDLDKLVLMVVGNKIDQNAERQVKAEEGHVFANDLSALFVEVSAKNRIGITKLFEELIHKIITTPTVSKQAITEKPAATIHVDSRADDAERILGSCLC